MKVGDQLGKYTVIRSLGEGGMATVYLARHATLESLHALKVLRIDVPSVRARLISEGKVQAAIRHPNVVRVTDIVENDDAVALVMEYIEGTDLERRLTLEEPYTPTEVQMLLVGIARGIRAAHKHGVVHRDLKPANVLLAPGDGGVVPKVTDFGLVKILASSATQSGVLMGTPEYMSPEQVRDSARVDARSDLWSLGAVAYEMACGIPAFDRPDVLEVYGAIVNADYVPLEERRPGLPPRLLSAVDRLLQVDPDDRFQSAGALLEHLTGDAEISRDPTLPIGRRRTSGGDRTLPSSKPPRALRVITPPVRPPTRSPRALMIGGVALAASATLLASVAITWTLISDPSGVAPREVVLLPSTGEGPLPRDAPFELRVAGAIYRGAGPAGIGRRPPGSELAVETVYGTDCGGCPEACPAWCAVETAVVTVAEGKGPAEIEVPVAVPGPVAVRLEATGADRVLVDGEPVDVTDGVAALQLYPGPHEAIVQMGVCDDAPPSCGADGSCPEGCSSVVQPFTVGLDDEPTVVPIELPEPAAPVAAPAPSAPAPAPSPSSAPPAPITHAEVRAWIDRAPQWAPEQAKARGVADEGYLRDLDDAGDGVPVTRLSWLAAKAFCAARGGLLGVDEPPLSWPPGPVQLEWRQTAEGGIAWRRYDGVTSTSARRAQTVPFTGLRCRD